MKSSNRISEPVNIYCIKYDDDGNFARLFFFSSDKLKPPAIEYMGSDKLEQKFKFISLKAEK